MFVIKKNGDVVTYCSERSDAEICFLGTVEDAISNFDEYTAGDKEAIVEQGYENYGGGKITLEEE